MAVIFQDNNLSRQQAIIWTYDGIVYWRIGASIGLNGLSHIIRVTSLFQCYWSNHIVQINVLHEYIIVIKPQNSKHHKNMHKFLLDVLYEVRCVELFWKCEYMSVYAIDRGVRLLDRSSGRCIACHS